MKLSLAASPPAAVTLLDGVNFAESERCPSICEPWAGGLNSAKVVPRLEAMGLGVAAVQFETKGTLI
jgi:hypothetical protein